MIDLHLSDNRPRLMDWLLLTVLSAIVIFPGLNQTRKCKTHEILQAEIAREMAARHDYVETTIMGKRLPDKPPAMHTPVALLMNLTGHHSMWMARFPSAMWGLLAVLATYGIGLSLLDRRSALLGAIMMLGVPGYNLIARAALPDMTLCGGIAFSCLALAAGMRSANARNRTLCFAVAGIVSGIGVLAKGPYGFLFPVCFAVLAPIRREGWKRPRWGWLVFALGIVLTFSVWAVPAYFRDSGVYLRQVIFQPDLGVKAMETLEDKPFYVYYIAALFSSLPLTIFVPMAIRDIRRHGFSPLLAMAAVVLICFTIVPKKRDHYLLPMYPFLSLAIAASILRHTDTSRLVRLSAKILIPVFLVGFPLYFACIQPLILKQEDPEIRLAKKVVEFVKPGDSIYLVQMQGEALAWVGGRYDGIFQVTLKDPDSIDELRHAPTGAYVFVNSQRLDVLLKATGPLNMTKIFDQDASSMIWGRVAKQPWTLYRLEEAARPPG